MKTIKLLALVFTTACGACFSVNPASAQTWTVQTNAPGLAWTSVASSADGVKLVATAWSGQIYTSTNSGVTWTLVPGIPDNMWRVVASSADGTRLMAVSYPGLYANYISTNSGVTWNAVTNIPYSIEGWTAVASSADGTKLVAACEFDGLIYTSTNSGATWKTNNVPGAWWNSIASSADGSKLIAVQQGGYNSIYTSTNSGITWTPASVPNPDNAWWKAAASSADGTKLIAAGNGSIYTSANSGANWISNNVQSMDWTSVASSADGTQLIAAGNGSIYTSTDSGITWNLNAVPDYNWTSVASSADGNKLVAVGAGGIWIATIPINSQLTFTTNNGTITITGYTGPRGLVTIPSLTNGLLVTSIAAGAFQNNNNVTGVVIPNTVTNIGPYAFQSCYNLTSVTIPASVTGIGIWAFNNCRNLTAINVDPANSFYSSTNGVLFNMDQTRLIQFPAGLGGSYTIPNGVTNVGSEAFDGATQLTGVNISSNVTYIGAEAFLYCISLTAITVDANNPAFSSVNGVLFDKSQTTLVTFPAGLGGSYTVPDGVTNILDYAFSYCNSLTNVTIPASVTSMEWDAFTFCGALTRVYFLGNAPDTGGGNPFNYANATVYYLPGTTGWDEFYADTGAPEVLWLPQVQTSDADFGVQTNQFGFNFNWASGMVVVVEACTNLFNPAWQPVQTNLLTTGSAGFNDPQWTNYPSRFYRLRSP